MAAASKACREPLPRASVVTLMRLLLRYLLLLLVTVSLSPGLGEALHDGAHQLLEAGQPEGAEAAHADEDCPEHGCTPMAHRCSCCASMHAMQSATQPQPAWHALARTLVHGDGANTRYAEGIDCELQRPPRA